jgi:phage tail-like protein
MADDGYEQQRITAATFLFEVDGVEIGRFMEISGLEVSVAVDDVEEGGQNSFVHKLPGRMTWPNITLKRGVTQNDTLLAWLNKSSGEQFAANGNQLTRSTAAITLVGPSGDRLRAWEFDGAFPVKWSGPNFNVSSTDMAVEELEITHHGFRARTLT